MVIVNEEDITLELTPWLIRSIELLRTMDCRASLAQDLSERIAGELFDKVFPTRDLNSNKAMYDYLMYYVQRQRSFLLQKLNIIDQSYEFLNYKKDQLQKQTFLQMEPDCSYNYSTYSSNELPLITRASRAAYSAGGSSLCFINTGNSEASSATSNNSRHSRRRQSMIPTSQMNSPFDEGAKNTTLEKPDTHFSSGKPQFKKELKYKESSANSSNFHPLFEKRKSKNLSNPFNASKKHLNTSDREHLWSGVCPACNQSEIRGAKNMVACDLCDQWYHFDCVGYCQPPEKKKVKKTKALHDELIQEDGNNWYCPKCINSQKVQIKETSE